MIIFDLECDGLKLDEITKIHCICTYDTETGQSYVFWNSLCNGDPLPDDIFGGAEYLDGKEVVGHNAIAFDVAVIQKFFPWFKPKKVIDTLILARMFEPDRPQGHSLESYAKQFGKEKVQNEEWSEVTEKIIERCKSDVEITTELYRFLEKQRNGWGWDDAIQLESDVARIITNQARAGWKFDTERATALCERLQQRVTEIDEEVRPLLKKKVVHVTTVNKPFKKNGEFTHQVMRVTKGWPNAMFATYPFPTILVDGAFSVIEFENIDLDSSAQMKELLFSLGWKPTEWNHKKGADGKPIKDLQGRFIKTSPKLTEDSYDSLPPGLGQLLAERLKSNHRLHQLEGLIKHVRPDGRIEAQANPCQTPTARMGHRVVVNIPKADPKVFLGREMRELFICDDDRILVGGDACSLEWRIFSHYNEHPTVIELVTEGDIHTYISDIAGLGNRNLAKQVGFAILYGAGAGRIAMITGKSLEESKDILNRIIRKLPGLSNLLNRVKAAAERGYLKGIDGRKIFIRSSHSALNALIQSAGSILIKYAMRIIDEEITRNKYDAFQVGTFHDEFAFDCKIIFASPLTELIKRAIIQAGEILKLRCPMDAQAKTGKNWAEIH